MAARQARPLGDLELVYAYLDAVALRVRSGGKVVSLPVLAVVGVRTDGQKVLVELDLCGGESYAAWKGCLDGLVARGLTAPLLCIIDGHAGLRRALGEVWARAAVQRCCVHKLRNLEAKAPKHVLDELRTDFHRIVYAASAEAARGAWTAFERTWGKRCPGVVSSLQEGGAELLTFFSFPKAQWKPLRTTNSIERLNEEFRRRVKTQGWLPTEASAVLLLFGLVATGQIHAAQARRLHATRRGDPPADARGVSQAVRGGMSRYGPTPQRGSEAKCGAASSRRATLDCDQDPEEHRCRFSTSSGTPPPLRDRSTGRVPSRG